MANLRVCTDVTNLSSDDSCSQTIEYYNSENTVERYEGSISFLGKGGNPIESKKETRTKSTGFGAIYYLLLLTVVGLIRRKNFKAL